MGKHLDKWRPQSPTVCGMMGCSVPSKVFLYMCKEISCSSLRFSDEIYRQIILYIYIQEFFDKIQRARKYFVIKKTHQTNLHQKRTKGRLKARWNDDVENDISTMGIGYWRKVVQDRDGRTKHCGRSYLSWIVEP